MARSLIVIAHNIRSAHNIGSLMRTCEGLGVEKLYLTGYTPYPPLKNDSRLPHIGHKLAMQIHKTALGAEKYLNWSQEDSVGTVLEELKKQKYTICALEQTSGSILLNRFKPPAKLAILLGSEVTGIDSKIIKQSDIAVEIPMKGRKESFNVVEAATIAMTYCLLVKKL